MDDNQTTPRPESEDPYVHRFPADWRSDEETPTRLTHAVAIVTDQHPEQLDVGIGSIVDPDALDRLFTPEADDEDAQLTLMVSDLEIRIRGDGSLLVRE